MQVAPFHYAESITTRTSTESESLRTSTETVEREPDWPEFEGVLVVAGLPGWSQAGTTDQVSNPYPETTTDVVKLVREQGLTVQYAVPREDRQTVSLNAAEYWLPVLVFAYDVGTNLVAGYFTGVITQLLGSLPKRSDRLHVRFGRETTDGAVEYFEAHGPAPDVVKAIKAHGKATR